MLSYWNILTFFVKLFFFVPQKGLEYRGKIIKYRRLP